MFSKDGLFDELKKAVVERVLNAEQDDPKLIQRYQRRFPGFDDKIVSMHARDMTVREIQGHLLELYGLEASPDLISTVTDALLDTVAEWRNRPLETSYPLVFSDAIRVKACPRA